MTQTNMSTELNPPGPPPIELAHTPVRGVPSAIEAILREPGRIIATLRQQGHSRLILAMLAIAAFCSMVYGVIVGTFSGDQQLWAAPVKIAAGLLLSGLICLPSLYIFSCLSGSPARPTEVLGFLAGLLALSTLLLIGFAPVAWIFSASTKSLPGMATLHLLFWVIATWFGIRFLMVSFRQLAPKATDGIKMWCIIFILVQLQMMTALRPIIGTSETFLPKERKFFVAHWFECLNLPR